MGSDARPAAPGALTPTLLRDAVADDLPRLVEIERASFSDPWSATAFRSALREERVQLLVATEASVVVGYAVWWCVAGEVELANVAVAPEARGRGIGGLLLDTAVERGRDEGCEWMHLEVRESNLAGRALYSSRGFSIVGRRRRYYSHPVEDALLLRAHLVKGQ
ncbi:MAG TPA: ribosomal protein S18-alanine N-acetyltransferase [Gemmatimonadaceae bacterium]|nr:ribosomal protein S18-alanine N-acetyltransferase [Gemmatimonadaceae bacterium]